MTKVAAILRNPVVRHICRVEYRVGVCVVAQPKYIEIAGVHAGSEIAECHLCNMQLRWWRWVCHAIRAVTAPVIATMLEEPIFRGKVRVAL